MKAVFYGHVAKDKIHNRIRAGGPPNYGGVALADYFGTKPIAVTSCSVSDIPFFLKETKDKVKYVVETAQETTQFLIAEKKGLREMVLQERAADLTVFTEADVAILSPICSETNDHFVQMVRKNSEFLAIDIQGFVRSRSRGHVVFRSVDDFKAIISADIIKVSDYELPYLVSARFWSDGVQESLELLLSKGAEGACVYAKGVSYEIPAPVLPVVSSVGAGDVLLAFYAALRARQEVIPKALSIAMAAAAISTGYGGLPHSMAAQKIEELGHHLASKCHKEPASFQEIYLDNNSPRH